MNGLEAEMGSSLLVLRIDILDPAGRQFALEYGSRVTPTFILLDGAGAEILRQVGTLSPDAVRSALDE